MFGQRPYLRAGSSRRPRSMTVMLLVANVSFFAVTCLAYGYPPSFPRNGWWALDLTAGLAHLRAWQFLTYQFVHADLVHLLLNSWIIYSFGREVEEAVGRRWLLLLYLCSGLAGALAQLGAAAVAPQFFGRAVVGASAAGLGLLASYASLYPERQFTALIFFIVPVAVRAKYLLGIAAGLALFGIALPADQIAHAAHFGGILSGVAFARFAFRDRVGSRTPSEPMTGQLPQATVTFVTTRPEPSKPVPASAEAVIADSPEVLQRRVDAILERIHAQGLRRLTKEDREVLERARQRISEQSKD